MTDQDQIIEIAKLDGLSLAPDNCLHQVLLPSYLTSRDAIVPVIERLFLMTEHQSIDFQDALYDVLERHSHKQINRAASYHFIKATPRQLCEALLRSVGKWRD